MARARGFNRIEVKKFYSILQEIMDKYKFEPHCIFNVDKTGISVVPKTSPKVVAAKGKRQVGGLTAAERGRTVTTVICISASGLYMPPMLIFPLVKENKEYLIDKPAEAWPNLIKVAGCKQIYSHVGSGSSSIFLEPL